MGLFDNLKKKFQNIVEPVQAAKLQETLDNLGIDLSNINLDQEAEPPTITGTLNSQEDLNKLKAAFSDTKLAFVDVDLLQTYTVQDGDSPWAVAQKFWGDGNKYPILVEANGGKEALYTGDVLQIPSLREYIGGKKLQVILDLLGYDTGAIDGIIGAKTEAALKQFQQSAGLTSNGELNQETKNALRESVRSKVDTLKGLALQFVLDYAGHSPGAIDGVVGAKTTSALKAFQKEKGLEGNGVVNEDTAEHLILEFV